jgi:hypothetical protein
VIFTSPASLEHAPPWPCINHALWTVQPIFVKPIHLSMIDNIHRSRFFAGAIQGCSIQTNVVIGTMQSTSIGEMVFWWKIYYYLRKSQSKNFCNIWKIGNMMCRVWKELYFGLCFHIELYNIISTLKWHSHIICQFITPVLLRICTRDWKTKLHWYLTNLYISDVDLIITWHVHVIVIWHHAHLCISDPINFLIH